MYPEELRRDKPVFRDAKELNQECDSGEARTSVCALSSKKAQKMQSGKQD
jgi:hypothetical protein